MSVAAGSPVLAIVRVRLTPRLPWQAFEQWLRAIPAVLHAAFVTGDDDYEVQDRAPIARGIGSRPGQAGNSR